MWEWEILQRLEVSVLSTGWFDLPAEGMMLQLKRMAKARRLDPQLPWTRKWTDQSCAQEQSIDMVETGTGMLKC